MDARRIAIPVVVLALMGVAAAPAPAATLASVSIKDPGTDPLDDGEAAARVHDAREDVRQNFEENHRRPTWDQIEDFRRRSEMINRGSVTGRYRGTTDEILQWAARKWGFDPDLFRAVATVESR